MSNICTIVCKIVVYQHRRIFHFFTFLALLLSTNEKSRKVEKFMDNLLMWVSRIVTRRWDRCVRDILRRRLDT